MTRGAGTGRTALVVVLGVLGILAIVLGAALALVFGPQGQLVGKSTRITGSGSAILGEGLEVDASSVPLPSGMGTLTFDVSPVDGGSLFVGTAHQEDLDKYLAGAPYDVIATLPPGGKATVRTVPGSEVPQSPQAQTFWLSQGVGMSGHSVSVAAARGADSSLLVMNQVPAAGVSARIALRLSVPWAWTTALILLGVGIVLVIVAVILGIRSRSRRRAAPQGSEPARHARSGDAAPASDVLPGMTVGATSTVTGTGQGEAQARSGVWSPDIRASHPPTAAPAGSERVPGTDPKPGAGSGSSTATDAGPHASAPPG
jgi:hypothetical protein